MALKNTVDYFAEDDEEKKDATEEATEVSKTPTVDYFAEEEIPEEREEETAIEAKQIDYFAEDDDVSLDEPTYKLNPEYAEETKVDRVKTLDEFSKDENFLSTLRSYAKKRFGDSGLQEEGESNKDYVRRFITHYRQMSTNTLDLASQVDYIRGANDQDKAEFGALYRDIQRLPNFYEKGGDRSLGALADYAVSFFADPLVVFGFGAGKVAATGARKAAEQLFLDVGKKGAMREASKLGFKAVRKPLIAEAGVEALRTGYETQAESELEEAAELREGDASIGEILTDAAIGAALVGGIGSAFAGSLGKSQVKKVIEDDAKNIIEGIEKSEAGKPVMAGKFSINADDISFDPVEGRTILDNIDPNLDLSNLDLLDKKAKKDVIHRVGKFATEVVEDMMKDPKGRFDDFLAEYRSGEKTASEAIGNILNRLEDFKDIDADILDGAIARAGLSQEQFAKITFTSFSEAGSMLSAASPLGKLLKGYRDADPEIKKLYENTFGKEGDSYTGKFGEVMHRLDRERRALMVTQVSTTVRNVATGVTRLGFDTGYNLMESTLYHAGRAFDSLISGRAAEDIASGKFTQGLKDIARDGFGLLAFTLDAFDKGQAADIAQAMLQYNPQLLKVLNRTTGEVSGTETLSRFTMGLNKLNIMQDTFFRRAVFSASVDKKLRRMGLSLQEVLEKNMVLPTKLLGDAVEDSVAFTFSRMPKENSKKYVGDGLAHTFIKFNEKLGPLPGLVGAPVGTGAFPFARFMTNAMQFQFQYSPLSFVGATLNSAGGALKYMKASMGDLTEAQRKQLLSGGKADIDKAREQFSKGIVGYGALMAAIYHRSNNQDVRWYEGKTEDGRTTDLRPFFPLAPYLVVADLIVKWDNNELDKIDAKKVLEGLTGTQFRTGASSYMIDSFFRNVRSPTGLTDVSGEKVSEYVSGYLGELVGGALTPGRVVRDVVAAFDEEEARLKDFNKIEGIGAAERGLSQFTNTLYRNLPFVSKYGGFDELQSPTREGPIIRQDPIGTQLTGIRKEQRRTPIEEELVNLGLENYMVVPSSGDKKADFFVKKYMGKYVQDEVSKLIETDRYKNASAIKKRVMMKRRLARFRKISKRIGEVEARKEARDEGKAFTAFDRAQFLRIGNEKRKLADEYYLERYGMSVMEMQEAEPEVNHLRRGKRIGQILSRRG